MTFRLSTGFEAPASSCATCGGPSSLSLEDSTVPAATPFAAGTRVLLVGDSHTEGAFGKELERLISAQGARVVRRAKIGSAVKFWLPGLPALLREHQPDIVLVALGANMRTYSATGTKHHVQRLLRLIREQRPQARVVWLGPPRLKKDTEVALQRFNRLIKNGLGKQVPFVDSAPHTPHYVGRDGEHYAAKTAQAWARGVFPQVSAALSHEAFEDEAFEDEAFEDEAFEDEAEGAVFEEEEEDEDELELFGEGDYDLEASVDPWTALVLREIAAGNQDRSKLTNLVFYGKKLAPPGYVIGKNDTQLARQWSEIRRRIVDPALAKTLSKPVVSPLATVSRFGLRVGTKRRFPVYGVIVHTTGSGPALMASGKKPQSYGSCSTPLDCALATYASEKMPGFAHYVIGYDGAVVATCSEGYEAWHAGAGKEARSYLEKHGPPPWWKKVWGHIASNPADLTPRRWSPNSQHIGIELLGNERGTTFTEAQYRSLAALVLDIERRHGLKLERFPSRSLLGHEDVNPAPMDLGGRSLNNMSAGWDPGASRGHFSWDKLWRLMRGAAPQNEAAPIPGSATGTAQRPATTYVGASAVPKDPSAYRKFRLTHYYVAAQADNPTGTIVVPIYNARGERIAEGSPSFFSKLALEGTGKLTDGRLLNVTGKWISVDPDQYAPVWEYHQRYLSKRPPGYSGLRVVKDRVVQAMTFQAIPRAKLGIGYGVLRQIPLVPFRTLAADIGALKRSEPALKGKGGVVPPGTRVFIKELVGVRLPDGTTHDGWFIVNDTGGGIFGAHFDVFAGTKALAKQIKLPSIAHVWFPGIERRIGPGYAYGLKDK